NADTFRACFEALERGGLIGIYPEGTTHTEARVQRIKTGAARIALEYESRRAAAGGPPLSLIPAGLTFEARKSFRGRVRVSFGEREPARVERIADLVRQYRAMLAAYHVRDQAVRARLEGHRLRRRIRRSWEASAGLPIFVYGAGVNFLPYIIPRWLARRMAAKETSYATTRLLASI